MSGKGDVGALTREQLVIAGSGNHGCVVGGKRGGREEDVESAAALGEALAKQGIARYSPGDEDVVNPGVLGGGEGALHQVLHHGILKARDQVKRCLRTVAVKVVEGWALHRLAPNATLLGLTRQFCAAHAVEY